MNILTSEESEETQPEKIEKKLLSILLTGVPSTCSREYLAQLLRNEDIILGIEILPNNQAEIIVASIFESIRIISQNFFFQGQEIRKTAFFQTGRPDINKVYQTENGVFEILMRHELVYIPFIREYLNKYGLGQPYNLEISKEDQKLTKITAVFNKDADLLFLKNSLGFVGKYYSIPFAAIDFSEGHIGPMTTKLHQMYLNCCYRVTKMHEEKESKKPFVGAATNLSEIKAPSCCKLPLLKCEYQLEKSKCQAKNFFGKKLNDLFYQHCNLKKIVKNVPYFNDQPFGTPCYSFVDDSFEKIVSIFEKIRGINLVKISNEVLDAKPSFVKNKQNRVRLFPHL